MIYSQEVVNHTIYNNKKDNLYHTNRIINNGVNQLHSPHQRSLQTPINNIVPQQNQPPVPECRMETTNNNLINKNQSAYTNETNLNAGLLAPTKNGNSNLLIKSTVQSRAFYSPPSNYQIDLHDNLQTNKFNNVVNNLNYFNDTNNNANTNLNNNLTNINQIKTNPPTPDKPTNSGDVINVTEKSEPINNTKISNFNGINSNSNLQDTKSQTSELNKLIDLNRSTTKAETKSIIIFKIIDQVVYNGNVVKETIVKNEQIVRNTGFIDWPSDNYNNLDQTNKDKKDSKIDKNLKKVNSKTNLKRSIKQNVNQPKDSKQDKKIKMDVDQSADQQNDLRYSSATKDDLVIKKNTDNENVIVKEDLVSDLKSRPEVDKKNETISIKQIEPQVSSSLNPIEDPVFIQIDVKTEVFAKWNDKNYYSGTVLKKENDGKWRIRFDDGASKLVREEEILNIEFIPRNQAVMFTYSSNFCAKGVVKNYRLDKTTSQKYYLIEHLVNSKYVETEYKAEDVFLNSEAGLSLLNRRKQNVNDTKFADVDLNNIIPRTQRSRISNKTESTNSISEKTTPLGSEIEMMDNDSNSNLSSSTTSSSTTTAKKQKKITTKSTNKQQLPQSNVSSNDEKVNDTPLNVLNNDNLLDANDDLLGPITEESNLFRNFSFMFSFDGQTDENEAGYSIPFDLERLTKQIKAGSGLVLENFEDIKVCRLSKILSIISKIKTFFLLPQDNCQVVLISHSFAKTIKYLSCLARGIPCVKYTFIIDSCKKNELVKLENYILPTGYSTLNNQLIQDRNIYKKSQTLFKGTKIYLISLNEATLKWLPLLKATKSIIIDKLPDTVPPRKPNSNDLMITDASCPVELLNKANLFKVPIVSIEYIIASLIHGKRLSLIHPNFQYNFTPNK